MAANSRSPFKGGCLSPIAVATLVCGLSGCQLPWHSWLLEQFEVPIVRPVPATGPSATPAAQAHAELLQEMLSVVTLRPPTDPTRFGVLVDTLNQGASLEGIYNGLVHSADYRGLEERNSSSSLDALASFSRELAAIELALPAVREFDGRARQPLAVIDPGDSQAAPSEEPRMRLGGVREMNALTEAYRRHFAGASVFILKRVLADEALRLLAIKQAGKPGELAEWFSAFSTRTAALKIDFGLERRNRGDAAWNLKWAQSASFDRIEWEVLNRLHRIVNEGESKRKAPAQVSP